MNDQYAVYLRKSRADLDAEARGQGETLARHRATLLDMAARMSVNVVEIYQEIVSGDTISGRPQMQRLLDDVSAGRWAGVLCMDIDRLGRGDSIDQGIILRAFELTGTLIITPGKTYDLAAGSDAEFAEMKQAFSRFEYRAIKRRMWAGRVASAREGNWQSPRAPFGYKRVQLPDRNWTLEIVPDQADAVRMVFELYAHGRDGEVYGTVRLSNMLSDMGFTSYKGVPFDRTFVIGMLRNPVYIGMVRWNYRHSVKTLNGSSPSVKRPRSDEPMLFPGKHPAIISRDLFDAVQEKVSGHAAPPRAIANPFAHLVYCSVCGKAMHYRPPFNNNRERPASLTCRTRHCPTSGIDVPVLERVVLDTLRAWLTEAQRPASVPTSTVDPTDVQRRHILSQLDSLAAKRTAQMDLLEEGVYTIDEFKQRRQVLADREASLRAALASLESPSVNRADAIRALIPQLQHVLDSYDYSASAAERCDLLHSVIDRITYTKTVRCNRFMDPTDYLTLDIIPRV